MHPFRAYISMFTNVTDEEWTIFEPHLKHKVVRANKVILEEDKICRDLYFLKIGEIHFFKNRFGSTESLHQIQPPMMFSSIVSFAKQIPSEFGIQALDESFIYMVSREENYKLLDLHFWREFIRQIFPFLLTE